MTCRCLRWDDHAQEARHTPDVNNGTEVGCHAKDAFLRLEHVGSEMPRSEKHRASSVHLTSYLTRQGFHSEEVIGD